MPEADAEKRTPVAPEPRFSVVPVTVVSICGDTIVRRPVSMVPEKFEGLPLGCWIVPDANEMYVLNDPIVPGVMAS